MTFWVVRAGRHGENEAYAIENNVVVIGWDDINDLTGLADRDALQRRIEEVHPTRTAATTRVWTGELWAFKERIQIGDWVALPLHGRAAIAVGRVTGPYTYVASAPSGARHQRAVSWVRTDLPRSEVDQDLLYSLGATLAVFRVKRNNAEERLAALVQGRSPPPLMPALDPDVPDQEGAPLDIGQYAADQIVEFITRKFVGHELARLVGGVLEAQGYQIRVTPPGADGGVDIIAGSGPMGFGAPRLAVQVKSGDTPADVNVVRQLKGVMPEFGADHGLVVSWAGFKDSVVKEARKQFFDVRLWDAGDLVAALQSNYERLSDELQAELPLKRIWLLVEE